ncbi:MAG: DUF488 family protein [Pseudomonadota bacterium]
MTERYRAKHVAEPATPEDGKRILVDRLWPRGVKKAELAHDLWLKEIAPSHELRKWYGHEPARWEAFRDRYGAELEANQETVARLLELSKDGPVTLLFSARDRARNQAVALRDYLNTQVKAL